MTDSAFAAAANGLKESLDSADSFTYEDLVRIFTEGTDMSTGDAEDTAWFTHLFRPSTATMVQHVLEEAFMASDIEPGLDRAIRRLAFRIINDTGSEDEDDD